MSARRMRVGDVLKLMRRPVEVDPLAEYVAIGVRSFGKGIFHYPPAVGSELSKLRFFEIHPGELVISNIKGWEGAIAVSTEVDAGTIGSNRFLSYVPRDGEADVSYLRYFFLSDAGLPLIQRASPGSADRNRTLAIDRFEALEVSLPPVDEQRRIAQRLDAILGRVEAGFRQVQHAAGKANALRWAMLRARFDRLSETWGTSRLDDVVELNPESVRPEREFSGGSFVYVDIASVANGSGRITDAKTVLALDTPARARKRIRAGDVLVSTVRPNLRGVGLVPPELDGQVCSTGFAVLRPHSSLDTRFLTFQVLSDFFIDQLVGEVRGGHYPAVNDRTLREARIIVPGSQAAQIASVADLDRILTTLDGLSSRLSRRLTKLGALRLSTLNAAFSQFS